MDCNMEKLNMQTTNIVDENIKRIGELFPNCLTERLDENGRPEVAIDFDQLRQELSKDIVEGPEERYQFTWPDKRNAIRLANAPTTDTLRPCREESVDFDNTQNLYIEGDNLQVLKLGKVKMIYIDPPYNTGNDFVYNDDFAQTKDDYIHNSGQKDEEGNRLVANTESNGRFHTDWLNMIYPRLKVAKDLLSEDGVIFISVDDNEVNNAIKVCNDVFGATNKIASLITINNPRGRQSDTFYATVHEYLLCYCRNKEKAFINGMPLTEEQKAEYSFSDSKGDYRLLGLRQRGSASLREDRPDMFFPIYVNAETLEVSIDARDGWVIVVPKKSDGRDGRWMWGKQKCKNEIHRLVPKLITRRNEFDIFVKDYLDNEEGERTRKFKSVLDDRSFNNQNGTQEVKALLKGEYMSFPKSMEYIKAICIMGASHKSLVLDFFSGSATTAHAVMQLNAEDGGNRKFIMVQLPEATDEKSEAYKAGYKNICEIGKERIRRAGKKILEEQKIKIDASRETLDFSGDSNLGSKVSGLKPVDVGFRVLKLDSSNMQDVYYSPKEFNENLLFEDNIKLDRTDEDLLFQAMIELGIELSAKIECLEFSRETLDFRNETTEGKGLTSNASKLKPTIKVWNVAEGYLMACFDNDVNETAIKAIAKQHPYYFVLRDASLATDQVADNFEQIWEEYSKDTIRRII